MNFRIPLLFFFLLVFTQSSISQETSFTSDSNFNFTLPQTNVLSEEFSQTVYICDGQYAYAYHSNAECAGMNNCKGEIKYTNQSFAVNTLERIPCCRCWSNVQSRCIDDNPKVASGGGGGDGGEAMAVVAIAVVAASAAILSNDVYAYPVYSFHQPKFLDGGDLNYEIGWAFGFRKTFDHSALEYGASLLKATYESDNYYGHYTSGYERWGVHLNYVHDIFYYDTPRWLNIYLGPSINSVEDFGYGGIAGVRMKLFDRLKFDVRYEYTTETNQVQAGLIFTYQKKYFWQN